MLKEVLRILPVSCEVGKPALADSVSLSNR